MMKKSLSCFITLCLLFFIASPSFATVNTENLTIASGACILVENSTGKVVFEKNSKDKMYPASTTKIITALLALENCKLEDTVVASRNAIKSISSDYATVYLNVVEELTVEQLLNILLIPSGNVAANILAEHISGSIDSFVSLMNKRAKELGCVNTNFTNAYGLHDDNHYTCAYDLYLISKEAMKYDAFRNIVSKTSYHLGPTNMYSKDDRDFYTTNDLIKPNSSKRSDNYYYANAIGIKTGYTSQAKDCLVAAASKDSLEFISVVLGASKNSQGLSQRYLETKKLFNFAYNNNFLRTVREENSVFKQVEIKNATKDTKMLDVLVKDKLTVLVDKDDLYATLPPEATINENLKAPISKGDVIGQIKYNVEGISYESDLIAGQDVEKSNFVFIMIGISIFIFLILILALRILFRNRKPKKIKYNNFKI